MKKTTIVVCAGCGVSVEKPNSEIKRNLRLGRSLFCSKSCAVKTRFAEHRKTYVIPPEKKCPHCHNTKPLMEFSPSATALSGRQSYCKTCNATRIKTKGQQSKFKAMRKERMYGITPEMEAALFIKQGGVCAICKSPPPLTVDHCHKTGRIRGLLCGSCNRGIGLLKDNIDILLQAARYLKQAARTKKTSSTKRKSAA